MRLALAALLAVGCARAAAPLAAGAGPPDLGVVGELADLGGQAGGGGLDALGDLPDLVQPLPVDLFEGPPADLAGPGCLFVIPVSMDFGATPKGQAAPSQLAVLGNKDGCPWFQWMQVIEITGNDVGAFVMHPPDLPFQIRPGRRVLIGVTFVPRRAGAHTAVLQIGGFAVPLRGTGT